jgi:hypothetical protein
LPVDSPITGGNSESFRERAEKTDHHLICHFSFACRAAALAKAGHSMLDVGRSMFDVCFLALALRRFLLSLPASML